MEKALSSKIWPLVVMSALILLSLVFAGNTQAKSESKSILEEIVDSYVESTNTDTVLKHLLDAKLYLSTAEQDLLVSHNKESTKDDIETALIYLDNALKASNSKIKPQIASLMSSLKALKVQAAKANTLENNNNEAARLLTIAHSQLLEAKDAATPKAQERILKIIDDVLILQKQIEHSNLKESYEDLMEALRKIIKSL